MTREEYLEVRKSTLREVMNALRKDDLRNFVNPNMAVMQKLRRLREKE